MIPHGLVLFRFLLRGPAELLRDRTTVMKGLEDVPKKFQKRFRNRFRKGGGSEGVSGDTAEEVSLGLLWDGLSALYFAEPVIKEFFTGKRLR